MNGTGEITENFGFSDCMGPELRSFVEKQLLIDLNQYVPLAIRFSLEDIHFDWSDICVEGRRMRWLDGEIENFSGITIFDGFQDFLAEGWMEFIETEDKLEVFWWFLDFSETHGFHDKTSNRVPKHVWERLSPKVRADWRPYAPVGRRLP